MSDSAALQAEIATLKEELQFYKAIIDVIPAHIYWTDKDGISRGCNKAQIRSYGFESREDFGNTNIYDLLPAKVAEELRRINHGVIHSGLPYVGEEYAEFTDGTPAIYMSYKLPFRDTADNVIGLIGISFDITERKKLEEKLQEATEIAKIANQTKTQYIMNMSHDIRTPFTGILGSANILFDEEKDPKKKEFLGFILQSTKQLLDLINEIIEQICNNNEEKRKPIVFDLHQILKNVQRIMLASVNHKNVSINIDYPDDAPSQIRCDRLSIQQILMNLVGNAIKFTPEGNITLSAKFVPDRTSDNNHHLSLILTVHDTGVGIPEDKQAVIFERFSSLASSHDPKYASSGLGLWQTKHLTEQLNGNISVTSKVGQGSTFTCIIPATLPHQKSPPTIAKANTKRHQDELTTFHKVSPIKRLLLVEDSMIARRVADHMLKNYFHCKIDMAETGKKAISLANQYAYDLIILDMGLPDQDGIDVAEAIHQHSSQNKNTTIVGLTAQNVKEWSTQNTQHCFDTLQQKPLTQQICNHIALFLIKQRG